MLRCSETWRPAGFGLTACSGAAIAATRQCPVARVASGSGLGAATARAGRRAPRGFACAASATVRALFRHQLPRPPRGVQHDERSEEHTSELQSLMRTAYAVFCLKKKNTTQNHIPT